MHTGDLMLNDRPSLSVVTAIVFAVLLLVVALLLGGLTYYEHKRSASMYTESLFEERRLGISDSLQRTLQNQAKLNYMNAAAAVTLVEDDNHDALHALLHAQLSQFPEISALYFATPDDRFCGYLRDMSRIEFLHTDSDNPSSIALYRLDVNNQPTIQTLRSSGFKVTERSWYQSAVANARSGWSDIFAYHAFDSLALPHSLAVYSRQGELLGVISNNVLLSSIGNILKTMMLPSSGHAVIFDSDNNIIASSGDEQPFINDGQQVRMLRVDESSDPFILAAEQEIDNSPAGSYRQFFLNGTELYHFSHFTLNEVPGINWKIAISIPDSAIKYSVLDNYYRTAVVMLVAVVVAILLAAWLSRKISEPLSDLVEHFGRGERVTGSLLEETSFETKEVAELRHSAHQYQTTLSETIDSLNQQVRENRRQMAQIEKLALVTQSIDDMCVILNRHATVEWSNAIFNAFFGLTQSVGRGLSIERIKKSSGQHRLLIDGINRAFQRYLADNSQVTDSVNAADERVFEVRFYPVSQSIEQTHLLLIRDITAQRQFENELLIWKRLFMSSGIGIAITSEDGSIIERVNQAFADMHGSALRYFEGRQIKEVLPQVMQELESTESHGTWVHETECYRRDGQHFPALVTGSNVYDEIDHRVANIIAVQDLTEIKQLQQQLLQSQKMQAIGTLAGGIVHDMSNVLASVMGNAELGLLYNQSADSQTGAQNLKLFNAILSASNRASKLTDQILSFSRMETTEFEPVNLSALLDDTVELINPTLPSDIKLTYSSSVTYDSMVMGNESQLQQVFVNLLNNAINAIQNTHNHSGNVKVSLAASHAEDELILRIEDTGCGIPKDSLPFIFDPFFTTKPKGQGTGLGLSIVKRIIDGHTASIDVQSQEGQGTTFIMRFTRLVKLQDNTSKTLTIAEFQHDTFNLVVVDDDKDLTKVWRELFAVNDFKVDTFNDPGVALAHIKSHYEHIDCIVTDFDMPVMSGEMLCQEVRRFSDTVPIVMVSGYGQPMNEAKLEELGLSALLTKPITFALLQDKILQVIRAHRQTKAVLSG